MVKAFSKYDRRFYDRDGNELSSADELERLLCDKSYKVLKQETIGDLRVSTVWLGVDHGFVPGLKPVIFETMIFGGGKHHLDGELWRYSSEEEALEGHKNAVKMVLAYQEANDE